MISVHIRIAEAEWQAVDEAAHDDRTNKSEWVRKLIRAELKDRSRVKL